MQKLVLAICAVLIAPALAMAQSECQECQQCETEVAVGLLKKTKKQVTVYEVEHKEIAVPEICLPKPLFNLKKQICGLLGKKCCPGKPCGVCQVEDCPKHVRNGCIRTVKVLKKKKVDCNACEYKWEITDMEKVNEYLYGPVEKLEQEPEATEPTVAPVEMSPEKAPEMNLDIAPEVELEAPPVVEGKTSSRSWILRPLLRK